MASWLSMTSSSCRCTAAASSAACTPASAAQVTSASCARSSAAAPRASASWLAVPAASVRSSYAHRYTPCKDGVLHQATVAPQCSIWE